MVLKQFSGSHSADECSTAMEEVINEKVWLFVES